MNKIAEFAKGNWASLIEVGAIVAAEVAIVVSYRRYLKSLED